MADSDLPTHDETLRRNREYLDRQPAKHSGAAPPLTEEELDASETEIHNMVRRGPPKPELDG